MGRRSHLLLLGVGSGEVRCRRVIKEKSPEFRSPEVGISSTDKNTVSLLCAQRMIGLNTTAILWSRRDRGLEE